MTEFLLIAAGLIMGMIFGRRFGQVEAMQEIGKLTEAYHALRRDLRQYTKEEHERNPPRGSFPGQ